MGFEGARLPAVPLKVDVESLPFCRRPARSEAERLDKRLPLSRFDLRSPLWPAAARLLRVNLSVWHGWKPCPFGLGIIFLTSHPGFAAKNLSPSRSRWAWTLPASGGA